VQAGTKVAGIAGVSGLAFAVQAARRRATSAVPTKEEPRWLVVTVLRPAAEVAPGGTLPGPLADLGVPLEIRTRDAPGDKGTELAVRLAHPEPTGVRAGLDRLRGRDALGDVRRALRQSKQLLEAGELLRAHPQPAGRRAVTPWGATMDVVRRRAGREGVL
jgi:hypothetical protein